MPTTTTDRPLPGGGPHSKKRGVGTGRGLLHRWSLVLLCSVSLLSPSGCRTYNRVNEQIDNDTTAIDAIVHEVDAGVPTVEFTEELIRPVTLTTLDEQGEPAYWDVTLDEVITLAMTNSDVLRDLGGTILTSPQTVTTRYTRPLQETDPRFGMEAALSAFDAQINTIATFQNNNRVFNNRFFGGGANFFAQDRHDYISEISKTAANGSQFALRGIVDYDANNAPGNVFPSAWQTQIEGSLRQPLLQGSGVTYNRIAGPNGQPGIANGVLIAKVNTDINTADFDASVRNYLSDVINAYWDLYYSYRDLEAKQDALESARTTWRAYQAEKAADLKGGVAEALAREQYYRFESELEDAIAGRVAQRTQARNGATGGSFRGVNGVQASERRLRLLIGIPVNDNRVLRAVDDPELAPVVFHWESLASESLQRRPELKRQRLLIQRRNMELIASQNFLSPKLDLLATYRLRGLGHDLAGGEDRAGLHSAFAELRSTEFQEWEVGVEFSMPVGFRQGHAAVQNAELQLARERAVLREQERQVLHDLSGMVAEVDRSWRQCESSLNRYFAASDAVEALEANREAGLPVNLEQLLDAQRRLTDAQSRYYLSRTEYAIAIKNVHLEKGALSEYVNVMIYDAEAETPALPPTAPAEMSPTEPASLPMVRDFKPIGPMTGNNEGSRRETGPALDIPTTFTDANVGTDSLDFSDPLPLRPEAPSPGDELSAEATSAEEIEWEPLDRSARRSLEPVPGPPEEVPSSNLFDDPL